MISFLHIYLECMFISVYTKPSARETNGRTAEGQVLAGYFVMQRAWGERQQLYLAQAGVSAFGREACLSQKQLVTSWHCSPKEVVFPSFVLPFHVASVRAFFPVAKKQTAWVPGCLSLGTWCSSSCLEMPNVSTLKLWGIGFLHSPSH